MAQITNEYTVCPADVDEDAIESRLLADNPDMPKNELAELTVRELSRAKALAVAAQFGPDVLVIGADTTVALSDEILGKPTGREDAVRMLRKQSTEPEYVITGVCLTYQGRISCFAETSIVHFNPLDEAQERKIQAYCDTPEPYDKAGAYGIQVIGDDMITSFEGDLNNIIGFPVDRIKKELKEFLN